MMNELSQGSCFKVVRFFSFIFLSFCLKVVSADVVWIQINKIKQTKNTFHVTYARKLFYILKNILLYIMNYYILWKRFYIFPMNKERNRDGVLPLSKSILCPIDKDSKIKFNFIMLLRVSKKSDIEKDKETQQHFTKPADSWTDVTAASSRTNQGVKERNIPREQT